MRKVFILITLVAILTFALAGTALAVNPPAAACDGLATALENPPPSNPAYKLIPQCLSG